MGFFAALLSIIQALPAMVKLVTELGEWMRSQFGDNPAKFLMDSAEAFERAKQAKTPQEKRDAATQIATLIRRL
jgi:hypothetical protein